MRRGRKITPTVGVYPTVFGVFLRYFHPTVYIPRNFTVSFNVSLNRINRLILPVEELKSGNVDDVGSESAPCYSTG